MSASSLSRATVRTSELLLPKQGLETRRAHVLGRLSSIDVLRGLVIVLMALDHVRDYFTDVRFDALDVSQTNALLYATRWITNLCAPTFVLLAGVSAYLMGRRTTRSSLARSLITRGLWLIAVEWTVINFVWQFNFRYEMGLIMQVIWVIGASMVVLGLLVRLPALVIGTIGLVICAGHNLFDAVSPAVFGDFDWLWKVLHVRAGPVGVAFVHYPLIPWVGPSWLGYALGTVYDMEGVRRRQWLITFGSAAIALFFILRLLNVYGDPQPWVQQETFGRTVMAFMNVKKYPPSLAVSARNGGAGAGAAGCAGAGAGLVRRRATDLRARAAVLLRAAHRACASRCRSAGDVDGIRNGRARWLFPRPSRGMGGGAGRRLRRVAASSWPRFTRRASGSRT